jgi:hypothetical protein
MRNLAQSRMIHKVGSGVQCLFMGDEGLKLGRIRWGIAFRPGFCLLAVVLLYTPFAAALVAAHPPACCATDACPMQGHHHHHPAPAAPAPNMECNHASSALASCSLNCCESSDQAFVNAHAFVLPVAAGIVITARTEPLADSAQPVEPPRIFAPLSPPPRA